MKDTRIILLSETAQDYLGGGRRGAGYPGRVPGRGGAGPGWANSPWVRLLICTTLKGQPMSVELIGNLAESYCGGAIPAHTQLVADRHIYRELLLIFNYFYIIN